MSFQSIANRYVCDVPVYEPGRPIEEVAREMGLNPKSIIKLASNENPLGPSPKAVAAMRKALATSHLYPDGGGFYLRQAFAARLRQGYGEVAHINKEFGGQKRGLDGARPSISIDNIIL